MNEDFISSSIATGMRSPMLAGGGGGAGGVAGGGVEPSMLSMSLDAQTSKSREASHGCRDYANPAAHAVKPRVRCWGIVDLASSFRRGKPTAQKS